MVTAEAALVLPVLLVVLAACIWVLGALSAQMRCTDAAAAAARAAARGDAPAAVEALARRLAPAGARVSIGASGPDVVVRVQAEVPAFVLPKALPALPVVGRAVAAREPGDSDPAGSR